MAGSALQRDLPQPVWCARHTRVLFVRVADFSLAADSERAPAYVKAALCLRRDSATFGCTEARALHVCTVIHHARWTAVGAIDEAKLKAQLDRHRSAEPGAFITKAEFEKLVKLVIADQVQGAEQDKAVAGITDRVFSLLDLPYKNEAEFRATLIALIALSDIPLTSKVAYLYQVADSQNRDDLSSNQLLVLILLLSRLVENPGYRYKIVPDTQAAIQQVKVRPVFRTLRIRRAHGRASAGGLPGVQVERVHGGRLYALCQHEPALAAPPHHGGEAASVARRAARWQGVRRMPREPYPRHPLPRQ